MRLPQSLNADASEGAEHGFHGRGKDFADQHDDQVDNGLDKAGEQIDERTSNKYTEQIDKGVEQAQQRTGDNQQQ